ncbi:Alkaline phosphatase [Candidatus Rhodobacter oscarellae]|uniref:Alkaline phosphatase n=1 Tax=Candidatus Rhodobacter oscarellae TaxID=1675527 RepID=A0A0J9E7E8_9RHOB|nr:calcium-binding protein [Candidatus Rhodobacter lobularis]KMW58690.1 Alkaline phosphatase [Candidatus Rhodobacter lobularis]
MLAALIILGLVPLAALPFLVEVDSDADDQADDGAAAEAGGAEPQSQVVPLEDVVSPEGDDPTGASGDEAGATGEIYSLDSGSGDMTIESFEPDRDIVELDLSGTTGGILFEAMDTPDGAMARFDIGGEAEISILFQDQGEVPADDIMLRLPDAVDGSIFEISLSDALVAEEIGQVVSPDAPPQTELDPDRELVDPLLGVIDPVDPNAPDPRPVEPLDPDTIIDPVDPNAPDPRPVEPIDPDTILDPVDPDAPADPVVDGGAGDPLDPVGPNDETFGPEGDLALRELLERDSDNLVGMGETLSSALAAGVEDLTLSDAGDAVALAEGTGASTSLEMGQTAPVVGTDGVVQVVDGALGDDLITLGSDGGYAFGGEGDDTLVGGSGSGALYGGAGADDLTAGETGGYADGGSGADVITGGAGNDVLEGGEHAGGAPGGDDSIDGGAGDDLIRGGHGADTLLGGAGNDVIDHLGRTEEREIIEHHEFAWHIGEDADSLAGGEGDDTLIFDRHDTAEGGAGSDMFWLYHDGADGLEVAQVADFQVGEDFLRVSLNPQIGENEEPVVEVRPSADGSDAVVIVNGDLVAVLQGAPTATASDVYASVEPDIFPLGSAA